jgi:putative transposase
LLRLREDGGLSRAHLRQAAARLGLTEQTVYRWLRRAGSQAVPAPRQFELSATDVRALEDFHGRVAIAYRARRAALAGKRTAAGVPIDPRLWAGWQGEPAVSRASFYRAVARAWNTAERAYWREGEEARRSRRVWPSGSARTAFLFDAVTGEHLGTATLADQATPEQIGALRRTRARRARRLRSDLAAAERSRRGRYAAATTVAPAKTLNAVTSAEAAAELDDTALAELSRLARPDLFPPAAPAPGWVLPVDLDQITAHSGEEREAQ